MPDDGRMTPDCPCCAAGGCPSCDAGHHAGERSHDFTGPGHSITRPTPDRVRDALTEVRARVYSCTSIRPDGERVIPQDRMLRIIDNVLKEYGDE